MITLVTTLTNIAARQSDRSLASAAAATVAALQRRCIVGRSTDENKYDLEGAFVQHACRGRNVAILLLDFVATFPSLDRRFMFDVLRRMRIDAGFRCSFRPSTATW